MLKNLLPHEINSINNYLNIINLKFESFSLNRLALVQNYFLYIFIFIPHNLTNFFLLFLFHLYNAIIKNFLMIQIIYYMAAIIIILKKIGTIKLNYLRMAIIENTIVIIIIIIIVTVLKEK